MTTRPRYNWFQSETDVVLTILKRGVLLKDCKFALSEDSNLKVTQSGDILFEGQLYSKIKEADITLTCTAAKVEIKLPKAARNEQWKSLLKDGQGGSGSSPTAPEKDTITSSTATKKNWDAIERQAIQEEEDEKLEGDAAVNKMFRKIYDGASDDVRRAMMKSYSESNGTVLSTNWAEIGQKKTDVQPPACMEYKKYEN